MRAIPGFLVDGSLRATLRIVAFALLLSIPGCATHVAPVAPPPPAAVTYVPPPPAPKPAVHVVKASWYGNEFKGRHTTSGEHFDPNRLTAASKTLPLGSVVRVENPRNGRAVTVRINDCGPFVGSRSLDLSKGAARRIGITHEGVARVKLITLKIPPDGARCDD
jgi:rare lipoprotein A (peptidoglycan hydrolase)